ncbi:MAG: ParB/RepB/Spo0J family partition protein [bacterium]|nr:ParB/RepB/Spo0J family partition protein [bacterium]
MDGISPRQPQNPQPNSDNFFQPRPIDRQQPASMSQQPVHSPSYIPSQPAPHYTPPHTSPISQPYQSPVPLAPPSYQPQTSYTPPSTPPVTPVPTPRPQVETLEPVPQTPPPYNPAIENNAPVYQQPVEPVRSFEPSMAPVDFNAPMFQSPNLYEPKPSEVSVLPPDTIVPQPQRTEDEKVSYADAQIQELDITKIVPNPFQPRKIFRPEALQELADSIREHGVIQPLVVTETPNGYEIVVGERRFRASQLAGLAKIPAIVKKTLHDQTKLEVALIENIQRQELNAIEEAQAYDRLIKTFNMTQEQVAKKVGKSRPAITNTLRLLNLPAEIQRGVVEGKITEGHARAILGLPDIEKQILMFQLIQEQGLNVRQVEAKVREIVVKRKMDAAMPDPKLMAIESELRGKLGAQVKIQRQGRGGRITIEFFSDEDLDEILNRMEEHRANQSSSTDYLVV